MVLHKTAVEWLLLANLPKQIRLAPIVLFIKELHVQLQLID